MSSGGGPRAAGSGRADEGKFRQRVDTHYKEMAAAKKKIGYAGVLGLAGAAGFVTMTFTAAMQDQVPIAVLAIMYALMGAVTHRGAGPAAGSVNAEKKAASYNAYLRYQGFALAFAGPILMGIGSDAELVILLGFGGVWLASVVAAAMGYFASTALLDAFRQQKLKADAKKQ